MCPGNFPDLPPTLSQYPYEEWHVSLDNVIIWRLMSYAIAVALERDHGKEQQRKRQWSIMCVEIATVLISGENCACQRNSSKSVILLE